MDTTTKQVMTNSLSTEPVRKMHTVIKMIQPQEAQSFAAWLDQILDTADVATAIGDYTDHEVIDYAGYYRAVYNEVKTFIIAKVNYALNDWKVTDQPIEF